MLESKSHLRSLQTCKLDCETAAVSTPNRTKSWPVKLNSFRKEVNDVKIKTSQPRTQNGKSKAISNRNCYKCGSRYHLQADCPENHAEKYKHIIKRREQQDKRVNTNRKDRLARNLFKRL